MKLFTTCMVCLKELGYPSFEPIIADYFDGATAIIECARGHKSAVILQGQKFEILFESGASALLEGYTIETANEIAELIEPKDTTNRSERRTTGKFHVDHLPEGSH